MVIPVIQFNVDKKYTSADVGYIMDKKVDNKDVASLIIYWAQHGYLKIVEQKIKKKLVTYLQKIKDLPSSAKPYEKSFFDAIFAKDKINSASGEYPLSEVVIDKPYVEKLFNNTYKMLDLKKYLL